MTIPFPRRYKRRRVVMPSWVCPHCGRRSWNRSDVVNQYCGACHHYCEDYPL